MLGNLTLGDLGCVSGSGHSVDVDSENVPIANA